ncbi:MAG: hypothetical protein AMK73_03445 [Planctomycetes bacterium SM23_32]|nr:MAG: hypothetical protein AMK73_03445 [Planctomycetes bacterium SM23_32]
MPFSGSCTDSAGAAWYLLYTVRPRKRGGLLNGKGEGEVGSGDDVARLEAKLRATHALLEEVRAAVRPRAAPTFLEALLAEKHRAERYNHYFAVAVLVSRGLPGSDLLQITAASLRVSDLTGVVDEQGCYHLFPRPAGGEPSLSAAILGHGGRTVGVILPETDREGAEAALKRLSGILTADDDVRIGYAVYPEDSTAPEELLSIASG